MKKFLKIFGILLFSISLLSYFAFLFVLPNILDIKPFKTTVQKLVYDSSGFNLDYKNAKLFTTPFFGAGVDINDVSLNDKNNSKLVEIKKTKVSIYLLPLLFKKIQAEKIDISDINIYLDMYKDGHFKINDMLAEKFSTNNTELQQNENIQPDDEKQNDGGLTFSDKMPEVILSNLSLIVTNIDTKQSLTLKNETLKLNKTVLNKHARIFLKGKIFENEQNIENISYNIKIDTFLPKENKEIQPEEQQEETKFLTYDFVGEFLKYNPTADFNVDLKIKEKKDEVKLNGIANIDNIGFKLNTNQLKDGYIHTSFNKGEIEFLSDIPVSLNEKINFSGLINKKEFDLSVKTAKVTFKSIKEVALFVLDIMHIENNFASLQTDGYITSDFSFKTNNNKLLSDGKFNIVNGGVSSKEIGLFIKDIQADFNFSDNKVQIANTRATINEALFNITGHIDNDTSTDISIKSENLPIDKLANTFLTGELKNVYFIKSGKLDIFAGLKGKLKEIKPQINAKLKNLALRDKINNIDISDELLDINITTDGKTFSGIASDNNLKANFGALGIKANVPSFKIDFSPEKINFNQTVIKLNNSNLTLSGDITNYMKDMQVDFLLDGNINTLDIKNVLPKEYQTMSVAKGVLPVIAHLTGGNNRFNLHAQLLSDASNNFTILTVSKLLNKPGLLDADISLNGSNIVINNFGLYMSKVSKLSKQPSDNVAIETQTPLIKISGEYINSKNPKFNNFNVVIHDNCEFKSPTDNKTYLTIKGNINANGNCVNPDLRGSVTLSSLNLPQYLIKLQAGTFNFNSDIINTSIMGLDLNGNNMDLRGTIQNKFSIPVVVQSLTLESGNINLDTMLKVFEKFNQPQLSSVQTNNPKSVKSSNSINNNIVPVKIVKGIADVKYFNVGEIKLSDIKSNLSMNNDILSMSEFNANAYAGSVTGNVTYNLKNLGLNVKMQGKGLDANPTVTSFLGIKDQIKGTLDANVDISLRGATLNEQLSSLNGKIDFNVDDGQLGSLGRIETYLGAANIMTNTIVKNKISPVINTLIPYNSGKFSYVKGKLNFTNGTIHFLPVNSSGKEMALNVTGTLNLVNNHGNLIILGKLSNNILGALGIINDINVNNILNKFGTIGVIAQNLLNSFNVALTDKEISSIPDLSPHADAKIFKVKIQGNINSASSVKTFQWGSSPSDIAKTQKAMSQSTEITKENLVETTQVIMQEVKTQAEKYKGTKTGDTLEVINAFGKAFMEQQQKKMQEQQND